MKEDSKQDTQQPTPEPPKVEVKAEPTPPPVTLNDGMVQVSAEQLQALLQQASAKQAEKDAIAVKEAEAKRKEAEEKAWAAEQDKRDRELEFQAKLDAQKKETANLFRVFGDLGVSISPTGDVLVDSGVAPSHLAMAGVVNKPNHNPINVSHTGKDAIREMERILSFDTTKTTLAHPYTGQLIEVFEQNQIDKFVRKNFSACCDGIESKLKKLGFLQGKRIDAPTTQASIPPMYLEMLSSLVRVTQMSQFVMHQFANNVPALGYNMGDTVQIPRSDFAATSTNPDDWLLDPSVALSNDNQPVMMGHVKAVLNEYGMGKAGTNLLPIAVPQFIMATSIQQLLGIIQTNLGRNYREFEDIHLRRLWSGTSLIRYNTNGAVSDVAPVATEGGALTRQYLIQLAAYLQGDLKAPTFDDGCYVLVTNPKSLATLINSIDENSRYLSKGNIEELTSLFNMSTSNDLGRISGYQFTVSNFHIFSQNSFGVGAVGTEGVTDAGGFTFRASYAVGRDTIGRATAMPFSIRRSTNDDFQRMNRYTWCSIEAFAQLDVDPGQADPVAANQQPRVVEIRTTDVTI